MSGAPRTTSVDIIVDGRIALVHDGDRYGVGFWVEADRTVFVITGPLTLDRALVELSWRTNVPIHNLKEKMRELGPNETLILQAEE